LSIASSNDQICKKYSYPRKIIFTGFVLNFYVSDEEVSSFNTIAFRQMRFKDVAVHFKARYIFATHIAFWRILTKFLETIRIVAGSGL
jgi:hypothetical protein